MTKQTKEYLEEIKALCLETRRLAKEASQQTSFIHLRVDDVDDRVSKLEHETGLATEFDADFSLDSGEVEDE